MSVSVFFVFNFSFTGLSGVLKSNMDYENVTIYWHVSLKQEQVR